MSWLIFYKWVLTVHLHQVFSFLINWLSLFAEYYKPLVNYCD